MMRWNCCLILVLCGCGSASGPTLYQLKGQVKFKGEPVPYGRVEFEPDITKGNSGGLGYAEIIDGRYDTAAAGGRGVVGGPHKVRFIGQATKPPAPSADGTLDEVAAANAPPVQMLFNGYEQDHDLPKQNGAAVDFDLPEEAAQTLDPKAAARRMPSNQP